MTFSKKFLLCLTGIFLIVLFGLAGLVGAIPTFFSPPIGWIFNTSTNLSLNYTTDAELCWYNITIGNLSECRKDPYNSSTDILLEKCQNTTFNIYNGDGWYSINLAGNSSSGGFECNYVNFAIDTTGPNITIQQPTGYYNYTTGLPLNFTAIDAIAGVDTNTCQFSVVYENGTVVINNQPLPSCNNTTFNIFYEGRYNLTVWANDSVGNIANSTANFSVDLTPPYIVNVTILGGYYNGTDYFFSPKNQDGLYDSLSFNATANEIVNWSRQYVWNSTNIQVKYFEKVDNNISIRKGPWNLNLTLTTDDWATDGYYFINVTIKDLAGNSNSTELFHFYVDNTAPLISLATPENNTWSNNSNINFIFNFTDALSPNASCSLYINGSLNQTNNSVINGSETIFSVSGLGEGAHSWYINCTDLAGNTKQSEKRTINIDTIAPQIAFISPTPANGASQTAKTFVINVSHNESNPAWLLIYLNSNLVWNGSYNGSNGFTNWTTPTLADGNYNYQVCANDSAGNQNCTEIRTIKIYTQSGGGGGYSSLNYYLCIENWSCSDWSDCVNGIQTRNCTDQNRCGTEYNKPSTTTSCVVPESRPEAPQIQICIQGEKRCNNGNVEVCSSDGVWQLAEICANGCENNQCLPKQEISLTGQFIGREPLLTSILTGLLIVIAAGLIHIWRSRPFRYRYSL
jgi:hypothetical protein